ncbi:response regulator, partial [bacterium]|nr:response regulator [bacterium]
MPENRKPKILIVDDEVEILKILKKTLEDDYEIITASKAKDALSKLDSVKVILSDQRMPEMTGSEFLKKVRETHPDIVRIIMTGYSDMNALIESVNQGEIFRYMSKPWDMETL